MTGTIHNNIGRWAVVFYDGLLRVGTVMDLVAGTQIPKRIRIQRGDLQGKVVMPSDYKFKSFLDETEVDP